VVQRQNKIVLAVLGDGRVQFHLLVFKGRLAFERGESTADGVEEVGTLLVGYLPG